MESNEVSHIRISAQGYNSKVSPKEELEKMGFKVLHSAYSSFGGCFFIKVEKTDLQLPEWAKYYEKL